MNFLYQVVAQVRNCILSAAALVRAGLWAGVLFISLVSSSAHAAATASAPAAADKIAPVILVLGDSLSAEYGLKRGTGWVALLEKKLATEKIKAKVVNASISGDTTSGGRSRLAALLKAQQPSIVIIELGGNDALRGLPLPMTLDNLNAMTSAAQATAAKVLLLGMQLPPNYGADYGAKFAALYSEVAKDKKTGLVPFFLTGVADTAEPLKFFQADRIHPNESAQAAMLANVWPQLKKLLK